MSSTILVADDDFDNRTIVQEALEAAGYQVLTATNGVEALAETIQKRPDVLLLDLSMPRMNGYDLIDRLRGRRPRPAVVVLTALPPIQYNALDPDVVHCIIRKPFDLGTFMALFVATAAEMCESRRRLANVVAFPQPNAG